jgi:hypothetical protein
MDRNECKDPFDYSGRVAIAFASLGSSRRPRIDKF